MEKIVCLVDKHIHMYNNNYKLLHLHDLTKSKKELYLYDRVAVGRNYQSMNFAVTVFGFGTLMALT